MKGALIPNYFLYPWKGRLIRRKEASLGRFERLIPVETTCF